MRSSHRFPRRTRLNKTLVLAALGTIAFLAVLYVGYDVYQGRAQSIDWDDGRRLTIDLRRFGVQYSEYSVALEVTGGVNALSGKVKLDPVQLQQLSESRQRALDFQKYVVAGYNACAISKAKFQEYVPRFEALDGLARQISEITAKPDANAAAQSQLALLVKQYVELSKDLGR